MSIFNQLLQFIAQANTSDLKTLGYIKEYADLRVKVSFGQGSKARVPWLAFLGDGIKIRSGFYPIFLFFKSRGILILALGEGESYPIKRSLSSLNLKRIEEFYKENNFGTP